MKRFSGLLLALLLLPLTAGAVATSDKSTERLYESMTAYELIESKLNMQMRWHNVRKQYRADADGVYHLAETYSEMTTTSSYDGEPQEPEVETLTDLPETERGEYERFRLVRRGDSIYQQIETAFDYGAEQPYAINHELKLDIVSGSADDFSNGRPLTLRYSDEAQQESERLFTKIYKELLTDAIRQEFKAQGVRLNAIQCAVAFSEISNSVLELNAGTLKETTEGAFTLNADFDLSIAVPRH